MPIIKKQVFGQNLSTYNTWLIDTNPTSDYFKIAQLPDVLAAGKTGFLIYGSKNLVNSTKVLAELIDSAGNTVFLQPIKNYQEGLARIISIEVYNDTAPGLATLTLLGEVAGDINGNVTPPEWRGKYNVKWQKTLTISPSAINSSKIRTYDIPTLSVSEILSSVRNGTPQIIVTASNGTSLTGVPSNYIYNSTNPFAVDYIVTATTPIFITDMVGGQLVVSMSNGNIFTSSIASLINNTMAKLSPGYISGSNYLQFLSSNFTMSYTESPVYIPSTYSRSFADVFLGNLETFSGDIYRAKIYANSIESPGQNKLLTDVVLSATEMLETSSIVNGDQKLRTGYFTDQSIPDTYWVSGSISDLAIYTGSGG